MAVAEKTIPLEVLMMLLPSHLPVAEAIIAAATYFSHRADLTVLSGSVLIDLCFRKGKVCASGRSLLT